MLSRHGTWILFFLLQLLQCIFSLVNLSVNKTTDMSSSQYSDKWLADEAVDGDVTQKVALGSCAVTSDNFHKQAWWRVDLGDVYVLNSVKIYYRKESEDQSFTFRLSGFFIYVADTLNWWIGTRCYLHNNGVQIEPWPSDILTVPCNATGRYVTVYKDRNASCGSDEYKNPNFCSKLELCEVNVLSCEDGTYGKSCSNNCSGNCLNGVHCNKTHGGCDDGCAPGFRGFYCKDVCKDGTYGLGCLNICGHCSSFPCNHINGTCLHGCAPGWKSIYCNKACSYGTFGQNCKETCSKHCNPTGICNHVNGTCDGGCQAGWMNHNCNESCPLGRYGVNCDYNCSENCIKSFTCKRDNGYCEGGCSEGWKEHHCNQQCETGTYGRNCQETCFNCQNYTCNITDGACQSQCIDGYNGTFCNISLVQPIKSDITNTKSVTYIGVTAGCLIAVVVMTIVLIMLMMPKRQYTNLVNIENPEMESGVMEERRKFTRKEKEVKEEWRKSRMLLNFDGVNITEGLDNMAMANIDTTTNTVDDTSLGDEQRYCNLIEVTNIPVSDLADVIRYKTDSRNAFQDEFKALSEGESGSRNVGCLPANIPKNRYKNMFPYDHSRVILRDAGENETDYINASYIKDMEDKIVYIACQGPKQTTLREHWRMIWQENIDTIVMLTNLKEKNKVKCYQYWPDTRLPLTTGNITITNKGEIKYPFYIVRQLNVSNTKTNEERTLTHFHFTTWPDHCTPDPLELISFYRRVILSKGNDPMLVHCSAGLGRTGVFIALDALMKHSKKTGIVKVFNCVKKMRKDRMNMVQTPEQYVFVHEVVLEGLRYIDHVICKSDFTRKCKNVLKTGNIKSEFEDLVALRPVYGVDHFTAGKCRENMDKNVDQDILPVDAYAVRLTPIRNETSDYINAVYAPSYTNKEEFIVSQFPLPDKFYDFWRMMYGYSSSSLVVLSGQNTTCEWMPEPRKGKTIGPFQIQAEAETSRDKHVVEYKLKVKCTETHVKTPFYIKVFKANVFTKSNNLVKDPNVFLVLLKYVFAWRRQNPQGSITVLSSNGAVGCGLFCGIYAAIEQIQQLEEVDIFTIMRQLQKRRPQLCSSPEEYQTCYSAVSHFIQHEIEYSSHGVSDEERDKNVYINTDLGKLW